MTLKYRYRYSDGNTYTDYPTRKQALAAKKAQNGGTITKRRIPQRSVSRVTAALKDYDCCNDKATAVRDMLSDLRHFCDRYKIDFGEEDRIAYANYIAELRGEC